MWSALDRFAGQGIQFVVGIILARLLTPREFGLIGMIIIFIAVSESFINSGFSQALIRKKECSQTDYSTVFFFNLIAGVSFFLVLFFCAPAISSFFGEPELKAIVRVLGLVLIINSLTLIQRTILIRRIDFKLQARISVISAIGSGIIAVSMACTGFGVWSLVVLRITMEAFHSILLWFWNKWKPMMIFSKASFKELFGFGSKLLLSGLIDTIYRNVYFLVIGKFFSANELGYYTRANQFSTLPPQSINGIMSRVTYPVLAQIQDNQLMLKAAYKRMIKSIMLVSFILMIFIAAVAEPMIIVLIGEKWRPSVVYLQLLCFVGMMYPLQALNLNMLNVQGRSDLFLKLEIIKKVLAIPTIIIGIIWGIKVMILGMWVNTLIAYYLNSYWSGRSISYPIGEQVADIMPSFLLALFMGALVFLAGWIIPFGDLVTLILQVVIGGVLAFAFCELLRLDSYLYVKDIVKAKILSVYNARR